MIATIALLVKNGEIHLSDTLASIIERQLSGEFELLVIDSGSTDVSAEILAQLHVWET